MLRWIIGFILLIGFTLGLLFFVLRPHNDSALVGSWQCYNRSEMIMTLDGDGRGKRGPEYVHFRWRTRNGRIRIESMGVAHHWNYTIHEDGNLELFRYDHNEIPRTRLYMRICND